MGGRGCWLLCVAMMVTSCGPKPASTGPYYAQLLLERWHRADPAKEITMTALAAFHRDGRSPYVIDLDEHCMFGSGNWRSTSVRPPSFGTIRMKIGDRQEVAWKEEEEGVFYTAPSLAWDSGDTLKVTASGGEAPGFDVEATVPAQVMLTSHDFAASKEGELHISRSEPLELRWNPAQGTVFLLFLQFPLPDGSSKLRGLWCTWPAEPGAMSVPTSVLQHLVPSTAGEGTNIYFGGGGSRQRLALEGVDLDVIIFKNEAARIRID